MSRSRIAALPNVAVALAALAALGVGCAQRTLRVGPDGTPATEADVIAMQRTKAEGPREPRVSAMGSDLSDLPQLYPDGDWLPIEAPLLSMSVLVKVRVNGDTYIATLDTGAMGTTMSRPVAEALGIVGDDMPRGRPIRAVDAHGSVIMGEKVDLGEIMIGRHRWVDVEVTVLGDAPDLFLIGADVLQDVDIFLAADEGIVGIFEGGRGPVDSNDLIVGLDKSERQLQVQASATGNGAKNVQFPLIVDTGAWNTSVPLLVGINGGLPADVGYESTTVAVGGEQTNRGRFVLEPMRLGPERVPVGRVLAIGSTLDTQGGMGLLGNDVMMRHRTMLSFRRGEMRLSFLEARPTTRMRGPGGGACTRDGVKAPCVSVDIVDKPADKYEAADLPGVCLEINVDEVYAGKTLELAITGTDGNLFNGGAIRAFLTANNEGAHACFHLWRQLERLGVDAQTPLSLRWVRTENVQWPCDPMKTRCITFTGPLAKLPVK